MLQPGDGTETSEIRESLLSTGALASYLGSLCERSCKTTDEFLWLAN